jgi:hypothetical protein
MYDCFQLSAWSLGRNDFTSDNNYLFCLPLLSLEQSILQTQGTSSCRTD